MDDLLEEYPRAAHHMDAVDEKIQAFETKYCTPPDHDDLMAIVAGAHADHDESACSGCCAG